MLGKHITENLFLLFVVIAHEYVDTWATKRASHVGTWARKHARYVDTWARKHARHVGTWARKQARHVGTWTRKVRNLADSISTVINVIVEITDLKYGLLSDNLF